MIKEFEFNLKTKMKFGPGTALKLREYLKDLKLKRIGVIVDSGVYQTDYLKEVLENLNKEGFEKVKVWEYSLKGEPDYDSLDRIKLEFLDENSKPEIDCFVGIGGGSAMDFAKGLALVMVNPGPAINYRGFPTDINEPLPVIILPTNAGTGSEVNYLAVFIDLKNKKKFGINSPLNFPVLAVLDPKLCLSCPKSVTAASGMDALDHALETYTSLHSTCMSRIFSKEGFRLVFNNLLKVLDEPDDLKIRANLQLGAYNAGIALLSLGGGPAGALSYPLGVHFKAPHGIATAIFLPHIIEHNIKKGFDYSEFYDLIEGADKSFNKEEKNRIFSEKLFELARKLEIPQSLREFGINEENIEILLKEVEGLDKAFEQNPVPFSVEEGKELLIKLTHANSASQIRPCE